MVERMEECYGLLKVNHLCSNCFAKKFFTSFHEESTIVGSVKYGFTVL